MSIKNIYGVARNYKAKAQGANTEAPTYPFFFMKPTHALVEANGQILKMPSDQGAINHEVEIVVHIARSYEPGIPMAEVIDKITIGVDWTLKDAIEEAKKNSSPWLLAKGFPNAAVLSEWIPFEGLEALSQHEFTLEKNGVEVQRGNIKDMIFDIPTLVEFCAKHFGLGQGDIIFTGTPAGIGPVAHGDHLVLKWKEEKVGEISVEMK